MQIYTDTYVRFQERPTHHLPVLLNTYAGQHFAGTGQGRSGCRSWPGAQVPAESRGVPKGCGTAGPLAVVGHECRG